MRKSNIKNAVSERQRMLDLMSFHREVESYFDLLRGECQTGNGHFNETDLERFRQSNYYLMDTNPYRRSMGIKGFLRRTALVLEHITRNGNISILDAGCGLGTHAFFFSHFGANVMGVDISENGNSIAEKQKAYLSSLGYLRGKVEFSLESVFSHLAPGIPQYDIIWLNEAISHIDPYLGFLELAYSSLKLEGCLVISDQNNLNPVVWLSLFGQRGRQLHTCRTDPKTGKKISYAVERCFSARRISKVLRSVGFDVEMVIFHSFIPSFLRKAALPVVLSPLDNVARRVPFIRHLSGSYTIIGQKKL